MGYKEISVEEIKDLDSKFNDKNYHVIYINYDKKNGIELKNSISKLENKLEEFYELYIFNEEKMIRVFNIGDNEYKSEETKLDKEKCEEKVLLIDKTLLTKIDKNLDYDVIKVRVDNNKYQYIGLGRREG